MSGPATAEQVKAPRPDAVEVVMPLTSEQVKALGDDLARLAEVLGLPSSASNTELILEAVHRQAGSG